MTESSIQSSFQVGFQSKRYRCQCCYLLPTQMPTCLLIALKCWMFVSQSLSNKTSLSPADNRQPILKDPLPAVIFKWFAGT